MPITPSLRHCSNKYKLAREGEKEKEKDEDFEKVKEIIFFLQEVFILFFNLNIESLPYIVYWFTYFFLLQTPNLMNGFNLNVNKPQVVHTHYKRAEYKIKLVIKRKDII